MRFSGRTIRWLLPLLLLLSITAKIVAQNTKQLLPELPAARHRPSEVDQRFPRTNKLWSW